MKYLCLEAIILVPIGLLIFLALMFEGGLVRCHFIQKDIAEILIIVIYQRRRVYTQWRSHIESFISFFKEQLTAVDGNGLIRWQRLVFIITLFLLFLKIFQMWLPIFQGTQQQICTQRFLYGPIQHLLWTLLNQAPRRHIKCLKIIQPSEHAPALTPSLLPLSLHWFPQATSRHPPTSIHSCSLQSVLRPLLPTFPSYKLANFFECQLRAHLYRGGRSS